MVSYILKPSIDLFFSQTEFEVASSQEMVSAKKKASTVTKDITV